PSFEAEQFVPWVDGHGRVDEAEVRRRAEALASEREQQLAGWSITQADAKAFVAGSHVRVLTPGSSAGEPLHILSALERHPQAWAADPEGARAALSAAISLVLRLLGRDSDPSKSREHVLLAVLAERRLMLGQTAELGSLLEEVLQPPLERIGALKVNDFLSVKERRSLAAALNTLLASPTFASWRQGASLDIGEWLTPRDGRTPAVIVSVAHLDDEERALVLGVLLEEVVAYMRSQPGSKELRALIAFDEVYGLLPPHPRNPPTKRPLVTLMKQGRAFGLGVLVATQNPMDLDYRVLSNAGFWAVGRLQTDADRARVVESLAHAEEPGSSPAELGHLLRRIGPRWFLVRDAHASSKLALLRPRWALSYLRGPMTPSELRRAIGKRGAVAEAQIARISRGSKVILENA
ncbi:MAG: hypothetical protein RL033_89, partial [Pseudomonadota bacterium]